MPFRKIGLSALSFVALTYTYTSAFAQTPVTGGVSNSAVVEGSKNEQVDRLFAKWNKGETPGAAVAVLKEGKTIYSRGYGMANLEYDIPNSPSTVFHIASLSKQFTAFAIHLLEQENKLSLDDDVRKYLPELHEFGETITIRQLLHHTSGLRDQWNLLALAGWRLDDVITEQDALSLIWRQRELNFAPGERMLYSNTGYTLLSVIVERVSGTPLSKFTQERIFQPLGMSHSHFQDEYGSLVKNRAYSYYPQGSGYKYIALSYSTVGPTSLFTTVEDLARWDQNFYDGHVGGKALLAEMQATGQLNNGKDTGYASGLGIGEYRGLRTVEHNGGDAGYRTELLRFPDQKFSVMILANTADMNPTALSRKIADIFLTAELKPIPDQSVPKQVEIKIDPKILDAYVGTYSLSPTFIVTFTKENDRLMAQGTGQPKFAIFPSSENTFFWKGVDVQFTFDKPSDSGVAMGGVNHQNGRDIPAKRIDPASLIPPKQCEGDFYSDELNVLYAITFKDGHLVARYPRGELPLNQTASETFVARFPIGTLRFTLSADNTCEAFTINDGRVQKLRFTRVILKAPERLH